MPLPTLVFIGFGVGVAAAMLGGSELRLSPRHALLTSTFKAYALFVILILLPVSIYFYVFHGDWFLLYAVDVRRVPSAIALLGFVAEGGLSVLGFLLGAVAARNQRSSLGFAAIGLAGLLSLLPPVLWPERLAVVGTFTQYRGDFGLHPYGGPLMHGGLAMGLLLAYAATYLLVRIRFACRRS